MSEIESTPPLTSLAEQRKQIIGINDAPSARSFLDRNFSFEVRPDYTQKLEESAKSMPHRDTNPSYWRLVGTMALEAARFGFPEASGHLIRIPRAEWLDPFHPIYMLSSLVYLADLNTQAYPMKLAIADHWRNKEGIDPKRDRLIWGSYSFVYNKTVELPEPEHFFTKGAKPEVLSRRVNSNLPVFEPDPAFFKEIGQLGLQREDIEDMTDGRDAAMLAKMFDPILSKNDIDIGSVLTNPQELWFED